MNTSTRSFLLHLSSSCSGMCPAAASYLLLPTAFPWPDDACPCPISHPKRIHNPLLLGNALSWGPCLPVTHPACYPPFPQPVIHLFPGLLPTLHLSLCLTSRGYTIPLCSTMLPCRTHARSSKTPVVATTAGVQSTCSVKHCSFVITFIAALTISIPQLPHIAAAGPAAISCNTV